MNFSKRLTILSLTIIIVITSIAATGCSSKKPVVRIGSKNFTENIILAELYMLALKNNGFDTVLTTDIPSSEIHDKVIDGTIDIYPEYTGAALVSVLKMDVLHDPDEVYGTVKTEYNSQFSLVWLDYAPANDEPGMFVRTDIAKKLRLKTISDLQEKASELNFAAQSEYALFPDEMKMLEDSYGKFAWKSSKKYENDLKYIIIKNEDADTAPSCSTEGNLTQTENFTLLEDDLQIFPPCNPAPVTRQDFISENPEIAEILNSLSSTLDTETLTALNKRVDVDGFTCEKVAKDYYKSLKD